MAQMWPRELRREIRNNPLRAAEVDIFDRLRAGLSDEWVVWYSRPWLGLTATGAERDGEADFIIAHPDSGYLAVEVKGGAVAWDPGRDHWTSRDRDGIVHTIKNPIAQARSAKYELLTKLKAAKGWSGQRLRIRHCVVFPHCAVPAGAHGPDAPREIFCDEGDVRAGLGGWIAKRLGRPDVREGETALGAAGIRLMNRVLAEPLSFATPASVLIEEDERTFSELTPQQYHLLDALEQIPRAAIAGSAGTGKTVLAIEKARRAAAAGQRTLLICFNRPLTEWLGATLAGTGVEVAGFHEFCARSAAAAGLSPGNLNEAAALQALPQLLYDAASSETFQKYDAIIVDEGQDFQPHWWPALDQALATKTAHFYVFYDDNQSVYSGAEALPRDVSLVPIRLSRNLRNTQLIHAAAARHYRGGHCEAIGPRGAEISWIEAAGADTQRLALDALTERLTRREGVSAAEIGIMALTQRDLERLAPGNRIAGVRTGPLGALREDQITLDTMRRFKGLERPVMILVASDALTGETELAYVGLSRARSHLFVIGSSAVLRFLRG